jgi:Ca-activated chloride channel family protein
MTFERPDVYLLALLLAVPALQWHRRRRRRRAGMPLNVGNRVHELGQTWRQSTRWIVAATRLTGITALIVALASPFDWHASRPVDVEGIAIELVLDRSGSMLEDDYRWGGARVMRLDAVRSAASEFILRQPSSPHRNDLVGLTTFARDATVDCPLTLDHEQLIARLWRVGAAADYREDGTAIGDGLGVGVAELQSLDRSLHQRDPDSPLTRVVVLLTDGQQNAGELSPERAAALARHYGIRVYVITLEPSAATSNATATRLARERERLRQLAESTGGKLFTVADSSSLRDAYATVDALEMTVLKGRTVASRRYWAVEPFRWGPFALPPLALVALITLAAEFTLSRTLYSEIP